VFLSTAALSALFGQDWLLRELPDISGKCLLFGNVIAGQCLLACLLEDEDHPILFSCSAFV